MFYSKSDPGFAFRHKEYSFLLWQKLHLLWWEDIQKNKSINVLKLVFSQHGSLRDKKRCRMEELNRFLSRWSECGQIRTNSISSQRNHIQMFKKNDGFLRKAFYRSMKRPWMKLVCRENKKLWALHHLFVQNQGASCGIKNKNMVCQHFHSLQLVSATKVYSFYKTKLSKCYYLHQVLIPLKTDGFIWFICFLSKKLILKQFQLTLIQFIMQIKPSWKSKNLFCFFF